MTAVAAFRTEDPAENARGLYGPESEAWRLNREAMLLLGAGPRALLLQLAHPGVAAGVDEHSDFRADPWARLQATLKSYLAIVYGTKTAARAEIRRLNELHRSIRGAGYAARDPALSLWVHATLVETTIAAYDAWIEPLPRAARERYYGETLPIGRAFGVPPDLLPADLDAFETYVAGMLAPDGPIHPSATARELAWHVLNPPLGPVLPALGCVPRPAYAWTLWPSLALLPPSVREEYGFRWGPLESAVASWLVGVWRLWRPLLPAWFRQMPQAQAADRRVAAIDTPQT
ncbi:MAG TPA: oxygenase MpaB family protein [Candidatus Limnocylindrales bacterium]|nr:oxygenase MpaB family protein [Candidatus Limnocylindrales bacterium]